jgi:methyl coenzyme M reductase alpha subunit
MMDPLSTLGWASLCITILICITTFICIGEDAREDAADEQPHGDVVTVPEILPPVLHALSNSPEVQHYHGDQ